MNAVLKIPLIILLLVACMQAHPAGNKQRNWPYSSPFNVGPIRPIVSGPQTNDGEEGPDKLSLYFNFRFNVPFGWNNLLGKTGGNGGSDSLNTEGKTGGNGGSDSLNTEDNVGDKALENRDLFEGDILRYLPGVSSIASGSDVWPGGQIPYALDPALKYVESKIKEAMKHYEDRTCVRFVPRTTQRQYVQIIKGPDKKCAANLGRTSSVTKVTLGEGCHSLQFILHELGHAVGLDHEHSRSDRDNYLNIHYENILEGFVSQFHKRKPNEDRLLTPFDFDSIMLYGETLASKNNKKTMTAKDGRRIKDVIDKPGLSKSDIERIKKLYRC